MTRCGFADQSHAIVEPARNTEGRGLAGHSHSALPPAAQPASSPPGKGFPLYVSVRPGWSESGGCTNRISRELYRPRHTHAYPTYACCQLAATGPNRQTTRSSKGLRVSFEQGPHPLYPKGPSHSTGPYALTGPALASWYLSSYAESLYSTNTAMFLTPRAASHFKPSVSQPS